MTDNKIRNLGVMCPNCSQSKTVDLEDLYKFDYIACPDCKIILVLNEDKVK